MTWRWQELESAISQLAASAIRIRYVPNTGNAGDALIASGVWQFFDQLAVSPLVSRTPELAGGDTALYAGGGNLVPYYSDCAQFLERCLAVGVQRALVLPHTIRGHADLLGRLDARFTLVCRDADSLAWVKDRAPRAQAFFAPDMALRLDVPRLFGWCERRANRMRFLIDSARFGTGVRYRRWRVAAAQLRPVNNVLTVFRTDVESVAAFSGSQAQDLSRLYGSNYRYRLDADYVSRDFLQVLLHAGVVRTNRLHVGIGAALLGKQVQFVDNSYGKIRAVYESSLSHLENVHWTAGPEVPRHSSAGRC
jgi:exopolysaccharide biosynthesis predicted pyruvyltransferase EpsI